MNKRYLSLALLSSGVLLAVFQLIKFDNAIAHTSGWTDGQADSWTVFSPAVDDLLLLITVILISAGAFLGLSRVKGLWIRWLLVILVALAVWLTYFAVQLAIQQHLSHFKGV
jgi:hypothetical protein